MGGFLALFKNGIDSRVLEQIEQPTTLTDVVLHVCSLAATQQINKRLNVEQVNETILVYVPST